MAEETKKPSEEVVVVVSDIPVPEKEKEAIPPQSEAAEKSESAEAETKDAVAAESAEAETKDAVAESASFKEESNKVEELPNPEQKALAELKQLVQDALNKHEFTAPKEEKKPEPEPVAAEEKKDETAPEEKKEETAAPAVAEEKKEETAAPVAEPEEKKKETAAPVAAEKKKEETAAEPEEKKEAEKKETPVVVEEKKEEPSEKATPEKVSKDDSAKTVEETIVEVTPPPPPPAVEEDVPPPAPEDVPPPTAPEEVSIWGIPLLADERSDVILLKFLRARDFKVKDAFAMLKSVVAWRKEFNIDQLLEEDFSGLVGLDKVVYYHGVDKEGHLVCYNEFGAFQDNELYQNTFADKEKMNKFLRWRIQFVEKSIRNLDFTPDGISAFVQVIDLKNSPALYMFKKELRQATSRALQLLQDNYPEFVAKQVFVNVPWWYPAYYRMINGIFTTRTKSKFVFAGPSKAAETLFKYIVPEQVPVQYGGLSKDGEQEFTTADTATEDTIKPTSKHTIEFPVTEKTDLVWEARVIGWDVTYGAEFVPSAEGGYTIIVQKSRKVVAADETVITTSYKAGEAGKVVLTFDNQTSKRKKIVYRSKTKPSD